MGCASVDSLQPVHGKEARIGAAANNHHQRQRLIYGNGTPHLRPAMAAALGLVMIVGGGSYAGFFAMHGLHGVNGSAAQQQAASATVRDLQILDANDQTIQQLNAFEDGDGGDGTAQGQ